jgi:predicted phosphoribosyltransferase
MFKDRRDAGVRLARALEEYRDQDVLVLAIPRGGVEVGYEVARYLDADFTIVITRKLPFPDNPEAGFGAIAEDGSRFIFRDAARSLPPPIVERIVEQQQGEIRGRIRVLRGGGPLPEIRNRIVILVDDGIAMGSTMRASIQLCKNCLLYTSPSPRDRQKSRMPSSA